MYLDRLKRIADSLGFKVRVKNTDNMVKLGQVGLMEPLNFTIYISPSCLDPVETLAHELGHVLMMYSEIEAEDVVSAETEYFVGENAADELGKALCACIGYKSNFPDSFSKVEEHLRYVKGTIPSSDFIIYLQGYLDCARRLEVHSQVPAHVEQMMLDTASGEKDGKV